MARNITTRNISKFLALAAVGALVAAGCGSSETERVTLAPPPSTTVPIEPGVPAETTVMTSISVSEADAGFNGLDDCNPGDAQSDQELQSVLVTNATRISALFPSISTTAAEGQDLSDAQMFAFGLANCEVGVEELEALANDGKFGEELRAVVPTMVSDNSRAFVDAMLGTSCLRYTIGNSSWVFKAPHRLERITASLVSTWLFVQQARDPVEFNTTLQMLGQELAGTLYNAIMGLDATTAAEDNTDEVMATAQQTCGYETVRI